MILALCFLPGFSIGTDRKETSTLEPGIDSSL